MQSWAAQARYAIILPRKLAKFDGRTQGLTCGSNGTTLQRATFPSATCSVFGDAAFKVPIGFAALKYFDTPPYSEHLFLPPPDGAGKRPILGSKNNSSEKNGKGFGTRHFTSPPKLKARSRSPQASPKNAGGLFTELVRLMDQT
ncbi:uncharacterized protein VTP21DRAFT_11324 [Calcarisporiella thermophila]|uniref:uncharacterized protein n=1 Tax=Calcarisporiella thermophila TaxID=911321 RepID=UPI0037421570